MQNETAINEFLKHDLNTNQQTTHNSYSHKHGVWNKAASDKQAYLESIQRVNLHAAYTFDQKK